MSIIVKANGLSDIPLRGDLKRKEDLPYRMLDRLLMRVRPAGGVLLLPPWDEDAAIEWLRRFETTSGVA